MIRTILTILCLLPISLMAQQKSYLKVNLPALAIGSYELGLERHLGSISALELGIGVRSQRLDSGQAAGIQSLGRFRGLKNFAVSAQAGIRFFEDNPYEHPFIAFHLTGVYYNETVETINEGVKNFKGHRIGASATLGFTFPIGDRLGLDLAMMLGYAPPRKRPEPGNYYFPQLGYVVYDFNIVSIEGGHFNPIFALRYKIQQSSRDRIRRR